MAPHLQFQWGSTYAARFFKFSSPCRPRPFGRGFLPILSTIQNRPENEKSSRREEKKVYGLSREDGLPPPPLPTRGQTESPLHSLVCALRLQFVISVSSDCVTLPSSATSISSLFTRLLSVILQEPLEPFFFFFFGARACMKVLKIVKSSGLPLSLPVLRCPHPSFSA